MIPKIIHLHWFGTKPLPESYRKNLARWELLVADTEWQISLWTDERVQYDPLHAMLIDNGAKPVQISNIMRYLSVYLYGGMYVDFDIIPLRLPEFEQDDRFNLFTEVSWDTAREHSTGERKIVPNGAYIAAPPKNEKVRDCFWKTIQYTTFNAKNFSDRLKGGVGIFSLFSSKWYNGIALRGVNHFAPVNWAQARVLNMVERYTYDDWVRLAESFLSYDTVYGVHTFDSSWVIDFKTKGKSGYESDTSAIK